MSALALGTFAGSWAGSHGAHLGADLTDRLLPVLAFLVAITVVAELSEVAGVFDVAATWAARLARGRVLLLWLLVVMLAVASTTVLSLDTTAVLLTPVVLAVARRLRLAPAAFALTTVWLANTASLLLPVSNLTNLLALHEFNAAGLGLRGFVALTWLPALVAVAVTVAVLGVLYRGQLRGRYEPAPAVTPHDRLLLVAACMLCLLLGPAFVSGLPVAVPAAVAAVVLVALFAVRAPGHLRWGLVPWAALGLVSALYVVVHALLAVGLDDVLGAATGQGEGFWPYLRLAGAGAVAANALNNLPAYLALETAAASPARLVALLIGVNCGPLLTVWASLATVLWRERCRAAGVSLPWAAFAVRGLVVVPLLLVGCCAALAVTAG